MKVDNIAVYVGLAVYAVLAVYVGDNTLTFAGYAVAAYVGDNTLASAVYVVLAVYAVLAVYVGLAVLGMFLWAWVKIHVIQRNQA